MIANSLTEKRCLIATFGKHSPEVLNRYFLCEEFDLSNFAEHHICRDTTQKKWFEKVKFEHPEQDILEFISPMPKVYVDVLEIWEASKFAKGIPIKIKELKISTEMYKDVYSWLCQW